MASVETSSPVSFVNNINTFRQEAGTAEYTPDDLQTVYDTLRRSPNNAAHAHRMGVDAMGEALVTAGEPTMELKHSLGVLTLGAEAIYLPTANRPVRDRLREGFTALSESLAAPTQEVSVDAFATAVTEIRTAHELGQRFPSGAGVRHPGALREFAWSTLRTGDPSTIAARTMAGAAVLLGSIKPSEGYADAAMAGARILSAK